MWHKLLVRAARRGFLVSHQKYLEDWGERQYKSPQSNIEDILHALSMLLPVACSRPLIRIGGDQDGAHLIPNDLEGIEACFSPGVDDRFCFEKELAINHGIRSFLCDGSIQDLDTGHPMLKFNRTWLTAHSDARSQTLDEWIDTSIQTEARNMILQMDIEGWEYLVLQAASYRVLSRFRIIVLELHDLQRLGQARFMNLRFLPVLKKLREIFDIVHVHPNNACGSSLFEGGITIPNVVEVTFYRRKENVAEKMIPPSLPHPLDIRNTQDRPLLAPGFPLELLGN